VYTVGQYTISLRPIARRETSYSCNGRMIAARAENNFPESGDAGFTAIMAGITINGQFPEFAAHNLVRILKYGSGVFTVALIREVSKCSGIDILRYNYFFVWLFRVSIVHEPRGRERELFENSRVNFEANVLGSDKVNVLDVKMLWEAVSLRHEKWRYEMGRQLL